jgi:hypothetical protein
MTDDDLTRAQWRKSSYSGNSGNCVEVAMLDNGVAVRDSKNVHGPVLTFTGQAWKAFTRQLAAAKAK